MNPNEIISEYFNIEYSEVAQQMASTDKIEVYIENDVDKLFWRNIFTLSGLNNKFNFNTSNGPSCIDCGERGVNRFEDFFHLANKFNIFAIDADYSVLTPNASAVNRIKLENKFIVHTFAYNKESIINCSSVINDCLKQSIFFIDCQYSVSDFFRYISGYIYTPLLNFLYSKNIKSEISNSIDISKALNGVNLGKLYFEFIDDFKSGNQQETIFKQNISNLINAISYLEDDNFIDFCTNSSQFGLNETSAYMFINGHKLERAVNTLVLEVRNKIRADELTRLRAAHRGNPSALSGIIDQMNNHFDDNVKFETLRSTSSKFTENPIYDLIKAQFQYLLT